MRKSVTDYLVFSYLTQSKSLNAFRCRTKSDEKNKLAPEEPLMYLRTLWFDAY